MTPDYAPSLLRSFERHLRAENRSDNTVESYLESIRQAEAFLAARGRTLLDARRAGLEAFLGDLLQRRAPATAATRYKVLRILHAWLEEEEEIDASPMARVRPPIVPEQPVPIVPEDGLRRLLAACAGKHFEGRRDTAIVMFLLDTGARRAELVGPRLADLDLDLDVAIVVGKGRRERALPFGRKTAVALDRHLRVRARHRDAGLPWLWLGQRGPLGPYGVRQILRRRGAEAGLPDLHAHQLRYTFAQPAPQARTATAGNGSAPPRDSRARVRELVAQERATGTGWPRTRSPPPPASASGASTSCCAPCAPSDPPIRTPPRPPALAGGLLFAVEVTNRWPPSA